MKILPQTLPGMIFTKSAYDTLCSVGLLRICESEYQLDIIVNRDFISFSNIIHLIPLGHGIYGNYMSRNMSTESIYSIPCPLLIIKSHRWDRIVDWWQCVMGVRRVSSRVHVHPFMPACVYLYARASIYACTRLFLHVRASIYIPTYLEICRCTCARVPRTTPRCSLR